MECVNDVSYKDFIIKVREAPHIEGFFINVIAPVADACSGYAYTTSPKIKIMQQSLIVDVIFKTKEDVYKHIYNLCKQIELHELNEHFKVNGTCLVEPHPERNLLKIS